MGQLSLWAECAVSNLLHLLSSILFFTRKVSKSNGRPAGPNLSPLSPKLTSSFSGISTEPFSPLPSPLLSGRFLSFYLDGSPVVV